MLKPSYVIDGRRWMPIGRAARLLGTNAAKVRRWLADGTLAWAQVPRGKALLVEEDGVVQLRLALGSGIAAVAKRAAAATRTARERGVSQSDLPPRGTTPKATPYGVFDRTWDPSPWPLPPNPPR